MLILALVLVIVAGLLAVGATIWLTIAAFQQSVVWGLCVLFVPLAALVFVCQHWERARVPFVAGLVALLLVGGSYSVVCGYERNGGKLPDYRQLSALKSAPAPPSGVAESGIFRAEKQAQLQIRLVNLHTRETELLDRKAALVPGDRAGAAALAEEIKRYNADLQPVLEQMKQPTPAPATASAAH